MDGRGLYGCRCGSCGWQAPPGVLSSSGVCPRCRRFSVAVFVEETAHAGVGVDVVGFYRGARPQYVAEVARLIG